MAPTHNNPRRHANSPRLAPIRFLVPTSSHNHFRKTSDHSEMVPSPNCNWKPRSIRHLYKSSYRCWRMAGSPDLHSGSRHSHNQDNLSSCHREITGHKMTDMTLLPPV